LSPHVPATATTVWPTTPCSWLIWQDGGSCSWPRSDALGRGLMPRAEETGYGAVRRRDVKEQSMSVFAYPSEVIRRAEEPLLDAGVPLMARAARDLANIALETLRGDRGRVAGYRVFMMACSSISAGDA